MAYVRAVRPKRALVVQPTFCEYTNALLQEKADVIPFFLPEQEYFLPGEQLLRAIVPGIDSVFFCNPNNPTGRAMPATWMRQLLTRCEQVGARLFVDECFCDLSEMPQTLTLCGDLEKHPSLFLLKAFTKSFGMAGVRLGYGLTADAGLLAAMSETVQPWNVSTLAQQAGVAALTETAFLEQTRALIRQERQYLSEELSRLFGKVYPSQTNFFTA